jgi:hypothetical protein
MPPAIFALVLCNRLRTFIAEIEGEAASLGQEAHVGF